MTSSDINRKVIKISGESGQGINSIGEIMAECISNSGFRIFGYREYPSLIKGGYASYQIDISDQQLDSSSRYCDLLISLSRVSLHKYLKDIRVGGTLIHNLPKVEFSKEEQEWIDSHNLHIIYIDAFQMAREIGSSIVANVILTAVALQLMGLDLQILLDVLTKKFSSKPDILKLDIAAAEAGYDYHLDSDVQISLDFEHNPELANSMIIDGNHALALGAIAAGVRAYYAYPMTPSSSILSYLSDTYKETGILVKQAEDEITAANMALGSMYMGTRALVGTSGGGFDLMTETLSLAAMTETPFAVVLGQRPGPATGLPTWTAQGDLNLALYSGHGEFARCVIAAHDAVSAYELIQHALNITEVYQLPVILLTDKQIAESLFNIQDLPEAIEIQRGLADNPENLVHEDRYKLTENGISPRWLPGQSSAYYVANSDEHWLDGSLTEEAEQSALMMEKRMRKHEHLFNEIPEPVYIGPEDPDTVFVGWGSVANSVVDVIELIDALELNYKLGYLHYKYIWPLKTDKLYEYVIETEGINRVLIENNYMGQLGNLIRQQTGFEFDNRLLKYDGRPFFIEDILEFLNLSAK